MNKFLISLILLTIVSFKGLSQDDVEITNQTVDTEESSSHIWFLASDELKGRDTGSPEIDIAASYIASRLRSYGVSPLAQGGSYFQIVPLESTKPPSTASLQIGDFNFEIGKNLITMKAGTLDSEAEIYYSEFALPDELNSVDLTGKIVVCKTGSPDQNDPRQYFGLSTEKRKAAEESGALALVETYNSTVMPWSLIMNYLNREQIRISESQGEAGSFSHAWVSDPENALISFLAGGKIPGGKIMSQPMVQTPLPSRNVIGVIEGTDADLKNEYILLSAHYDHVGFRSGTNGEDSIFNGARDNAIGTAAILTAAKSLVANPPKRSVIFLACTGEEKGLLGSRYFAMNSPVPLNQIVFNLNSDGGGYNDTTKAGIMGLTRTNAENAITSACEAFGLGTIADPAPEQNLFDRSDNVNFARVGIPAPTFSTGFTSFDEEIRKYYHQVTDNPETLDYAYIGKFLKAYTLAARRIANMDERPFWNPGDKYEAAGKKLYGLD